MCEASIETPLAVLHLGDYSSGGLPSHLSSSMQQICFACSATTVVTKSLNVFSFSCSHNHSVGRYADKVGHHTFYQSDSVFAL